MANSNGWGDGAGNNAIGWGQGANNAIGYASVYASSNAGLTDIIGVTTDSDAAAFITASGITDQTQKDAINTLVLDLKGYSIWTKFKALYPFVGGSATAHKYNLKDPRDLDAAFRIVWGGGVTHNSNGVTGNGTNAYGDTKLIPSTQIASSGSFSFGIYNRTLGSENKIQIGCAETFSNYMFVRYSDTNTYVVFGSQSTSGVATNSQGLFTANRRSTNATYTEVYRNGTRFINQVKDTGLSTNSLSVLATHNSSSFGSYSAFNLGFAFVASGLEQTEVSNLNTAVQKFQTSLSRNV